MKVGIVAGEKSGDYLGAELIKAIRQRHPDAEFVGLAGPLMMAQGAVSLAEMDKISIFGLDGLFSSLREILAIRRKLFRHFVDWQPDVFIGIDVPDFNLGLEIKLRKRGIPVVHYVSPTVWAWRGGRIRKIRRAVDLMLTLFPFEEQYYRQQQVPVTYVGHPLARQIMNWQVAPEFVEWLEVGEKRVIAVLPGSRMKEVSRLAPIMLAAIESLSQQFPDLQFVIPAANQKIRTFLDQSEGVNSPAIKLIDGRSHDVLALSDLAILASGTAALEAALFGKPMVVMYQVSWLSALVFRRSISVEHYSMPNHLTDPPAVPELIQEHATAENLQREVSRLLTDQAAFSAMQQALQQVAPELDMDSGALASAAIDELLSSGDQ